MLGLFLMSMKNSCWLVDNTQIYKVSLDVTTHTYPELPNAYLDILPISYLPCQSFITAYDVFIYVIRDDEVGICLISHRNVENNFSQKVRWVLGNICYFTRCGKIAKSAKIKMSLCYHYCVSWCRTNFCLHELGYCSASNWGKYKNALNIVN